MIVLERSYSHPIRRITTIHRQARLRSESWMPSPIRISINQIPLQQKSQEWQSINLCRHSSKSHVYLSSQSQIDNSLDIAQLNKNLTFKQQEVNSLKQKLIQSLETIEKQEAIIKEWEQKYQEQEKEHNREIAQLKSNLDNSIFDEPQQQPNMIQDYYEAIDDLQVIQEESDCPQLKSLNQSVAQQIKNNEIITALNQINLDDSQNGDPSSEQFILRKINKLVEQLRKLEEELDDWKCNYWNLEKKLNSQLKDNLLQQGNQEIEIEFDFDKNQLVETTNIQQNTRRSLQDENSALLAEIKRLQEINEQLANNQKNQAKQVLEQLINKQKKQSRKKNLTHIPEPSNKMHNQLSGHQYNSHQNTSTKNKQTYQGSPNQQRTPQPLNQYFSHYFQSQRDHNHHNSPIIITRVQQQAPKCEIKYMKDISMDHYYNLSVQQTPLIVKQSSLSPYQRSVHKFIQF